MNKFFKFLCFGLVTVVVCFTSCGEDDSTPVVTCDNVQCPEGFECQVSNGIAECFSSSLKLVNGDITADQTWTADKIWVLDGRVIVDNGATLTIEPGTIIKGKGGIGSLASALVIARGSKIMAAGTASQPIIFTSESDNITFGQKVGTNLDPETSRGFWGGVIILGNAPISPKSGTTEQIEGIPANVLGGNYGGNDTEDNSGVFTYVSIRHGGTLIGNGNEINGLTLGGVGAGTTIHHVEVVANVDDGIEFFGGTVNVSNTIVMYQGDDAYDVDQGYAGTLENFAYIAGGSSDHALEIDGPEGSENPNGKFTFQNGYLIGDVGGYADFRSRAQGTIKNLFFTGFATDASVELDDSVTSANYSNGDLVLENLVFDAPNGVSIEDISEDKSNDNPNFDADFAIANSVSNIKPAANTFDKSAFAGWSFADNKGMLGEF